MLCNRVFSRPIRLRRIWTRGLITKPFEDSSISRDEIYKPDDSSRGVLTSSNIPEYFNFTRDVIDKWAQVQKEEELETPPVEGVVNKKHLALWWTSDHRPHVHAKWTFEELSHITNRTAYALTSPLDVSRGDVIVSMMPMLPQYWTVQLACIKSGIVFAPSTYKSREAMRHSLQLAKPKMIIVAEFLIDAIDSIIADCPSVTHKVFIPARRSAFRKIGWFNFADVYHQCPGTYDKVVDTKSDDVMNIYFTSGTVDAPKMVPQTHASYGIGHLQTGKYFLDLNREDLHWNLIRDSGWAKVSWSSVFGPWSVGASVYSRQSDDILPQHYLDILCEHPITTMCGGPADYRVLMQGDVKNSNFKALRHCVSGGDVLNPDIIDQWKESTGLTIKDGYGQTETTVVCANYGDNKVKPGSMGKAVPGYNVKIIDVNENVVENGVIGEIALSLKPDKPLGLFNGYMSNCKQNNAVFSEDYYKTGDQGYIDAEGYIYFISRDTDLIYVDSSPISPYSIESAISVHDCVRECAAISTPDHLHLQGQLIKLFVVVNESYSHMDEEDLLTVIKDHAEEMLLEKLRPSQYVFTKEIPKTANGKVKRSVLRNQEWH